MSSSRTAGPTPVSAARSMQMVELLVRLAASTGRQADTEAVKAALASAQRAIGSPPTPPWAWLTEAGFRVGVRIDRVRLPWTKAQGLLVTGRLIARGRDGWILILGHSGDRVGVERPGTGEQTSLSVAELLDELGAGGPDEELDLGLAQGLTPASGPPSRESLHPARRLMRLIRPDRKDIKTLVVFALVVGLLNLATPVAVEALVNTVAFVGLLQPIVVLAMVLAACLGLAAMIRALEAVVVELIQRRVFVRVATDLAYRLPRVRREALDRVHGPELVNRFFDITTVQKVGSKLLLDGVTAILSTAIGLLVLAFYHPLLLAFDVLLLAALVLIVFVMGRGGMQTAIKESSAKYAVADWLEELVRHPLAFHLAGGREIALDHADTLANVYLERRRIHYRIVLRQLIGALTLQVVTSTLLLGLGGWLVKIGELTLGQLVASWLIVSLVLAAVAKLGRQLEGVYDLLAASDKLGVLFDLPLEEEGGEDLAPSSSPASLQLDGVGHTWPGGATAFKDVDLNITPGESIALLGPSGVGKTTLLELIQGQRSASAGRIVFDGVELRSLRLASLRPLVGLARSGEVISASVAENVRLGRQLTLAEVRRALESTGLWEVVQSLPAGLDTELTSFGRPLSEGQADQLALARVIASQPRLLLVDGLLDGLEEEIQERVLRCLTQDAPWTLIVATRRADVAARCERQLKLSRRGLEEVQA